MRIPLEEKAVRNPIFLEPSGRRWAFFRVLAAAAAAFAFTGFSSVAVRSYEDPVLPILDLPVQQHLVALPRTTEIVPQNLRSELDPSVIRRQRSDLPPVSGRSATAEPATGAAFFLN